MGAGEPHHAADPAARAPRCGARSPSSTRARSGCSSRGRTPDNAQLWSPGIKLGVRRGSFFHRTECFGPVLGLMRAENLDEAIDLANDTPFGLTSGIQTLDDREVARWVERIEAGNLYVNRPITGAIVGRQPFGGWKASSVGPGAKAGGPNYVLQLARWRQVDAAARRRRAAAGVAGGAARAVPGRAGRDADARALVRASAASYARAWRGHFSREHDPSAILGERNVFRYRPCRRDHRARHRRGRRRARAGRARGLAAGVPLTVSLPPDAALAVARGARRRDGRGGDRGGVRGAPGASGRRRARARLGAGLDRRPRRRQRRGVTVIDAPVARQRPPRAPLVPARADGLARASIATAT